MDNVGDDGEWSSVLTADQTTAKVAPRVVYRVVSSMMTATCGGC